MGRFGHQLGRFGSGLRAVLESEITVNMT